MIGILLRPKFLSLKNSLTIGTIVRRLPFIAVGVGIWILVYIGTLKVLSFLRGVEFLGDIIAERLFSLIFYSLMGFLLLSNVITALSSFYLSKDVPFLLSKPLTVKEILRVKFIETVVQSSWMVLSFAPAIFMAYGASYGAPMLFYVSVLASLLMLVFIMGGAGVAASHILTRIFPARRSKDVLLFLGFSIILLLYFFVKSVIPADSASDKDIITSFMKIRLDYPFLPAYWITETVLPTLKNSRPGLFYGLVLFSNCAFFLLISASLGARVYIGNLGRIQPAGDAKDSVLARNYYPGRKRALTYKDIKIFFRDTGQWSQIFVIGALVVIYIYNFKSVPVAAVSEFSPHAKELLVLINMLMAGLVLSAVAARFLYTSVSLEGQAFWVIRAAPVDIRTFLRSKFLNGFLPVASVAIVLVYGTSAALGLDAPLLYLSLVTTLLLSFSICGLGTGLGAIYPKFKYENIASVSMSLGGMAFMLLAFLVVLATLAIESWVYYRYAFRTGIDTAFSSSEKIPLVVWTAVILLINAFAFYLPMRAGEKRLAGWI
jgi:ABC-2 type transport system permease protein